MKKFIEKALEALAICGGLTLLFLLIFNDLFIASFYYKLLAISFVAIAAYGIFMAEKLKKELEE